jgi:DNA-binding IclR family transcriptional regulator
MTMNKRDDASYEIEALSKGLKVLEALEGTNFEPVKQSRIEQRTGFDRNLVMRTLKTLRINGYAIQNDRGEWTTGSRFVRFAGSLTRHKGI